MSQQVVVAVPAVETVVGCRGCDRQVGLRKSQTTTGDDRFGLNISRHKTYQIAPGAGRTPSLQLHVQTMRCFIRWAAARGRGSTTLPEEDRVQVLRVACSSVGVAGVALVAVGRAIGLAVVDVGLSAVPID